MSILIFISLVMTSWLLLFGISGVSESVNTYKENSTTQKTFKVEFINAEEFNNLKSVYSELEELLKSEFDLNYVKLFSFDTVPVCIVNSEKALNKNYISGDGFTESDEKQIIINSFFEPEFKIGDYFELNSQQYKVIGKEIVEEYHFIRSSDMTGNTCINMIEFTLSEIPSDYMTKEVCKKINDAFKEFVCYVTPPEKLNMLEIYSGNETVFKTIISSVLAFINIAFLYSYMIKKRMKAFTVFRICGCSRLRGCMLLIYELLFINIMQFVFSVVTYIIVINRLVLTVKASFASVMITFGIVIVLNFLIILPVIIKSIQMNPKEMLTGGL